MGLFFLVTACLVAVGYYGYRKLQVLEHQIRAELDEEARESSGETAEESPPAVASAPGREVVKGPDDSAEALVLQKVLESPGILQTQLYAALPEKNKKELQTVLLRMDRKGRLRRVRKGNSYELHPL